ncbi:protein Rod1p [[Candida] anglica]
MVKKSSSQNKQTALFDIRLKNLDHDVLVLKGTENEAASVLLVGKIAISLNEPLHIKKLSLRLYSTIQLDWTEQYQTSKGVIPKPMKFSKKIYEHNWDHNELKKELSALTEGNSTSPSLSRQQSTTSLKNLGHSFRSKSSTNLHLSSLHQFSSSNLSSLSGSSTNLSGLNGANGNSGSGGTLPPGNHEIPFSAILPGNIPESVEGLPGGSVVYKLEATIERGKFHNNLVSKKHLRVVRTLTTDAVELSETVAVDNTWPKKVEYSLNVPSKAIAIGSTTPISFMLVPLLKGLRLGDIKIQLLEYYSYVGYLPPPHNGERILAEKTIPKPSEDDPNFQMDRWEVDSYIRVPDTLSKCTQDCDIETHLKVRHKLKFVIGLVNPDGHVSELRASLPIQLFISPFICIRAKYDAEESENNSIDASSPQGSVTGRGYDGGDDEELLFASDLHSGSHTSLNHLGGDSSSIAPANGSGTGTGLGTAGSSVTSFAGFMAPPLYEKHVYDRLWSDVSPVDSPINSGTATPRSNDRSFHNLHNNNVQQQFSMSPLDTNQLSENLRQLSLQRQLQESQEAGSTPSGRNRAVFNLDGEQSGPGPSEAGDYFSAVRQGASAPTSENYPNALSSPGITSPPIHLSRAGSENLLNPSIMAKVPSYTQAMRSDLQEEPLSPAYEPPLPGSNINLQELSRRLEEHQPRQGGPQYMSSSLGHSRSKSLLSRGSSSINLKGLGHNSRNSSAGSSPSNSRNVSYTNLSANQSLSRSPSKRSVNSNSSTSFSLTPLSGSSAPQKQSESVPETSQHATLPALVQLSGSASDRSALVKNNSHSGVPKKSASSLSLQNMPFLHKKHGKG